MEEKGLRAASIVKAYQIIGRLFRIAVSDGRLAQSPCRNIWLPKVETTEKRFLTAVQVADLAQEIDSRFRAFVLTAAYTGLRYGELAALRLGNFHALRRTLRVEEALTEVSGQLFFGPPKTASSRRTVSLPPFLVDEIARHLDAFPDPSRLDFTSPHGGPLRRSNFYRRFWLPAVRASVGPPCRFHDLRHTHAALLIQQGTHAAVIQQRLGHSSIKTTLDTYGHLFDGLDEAAADALDTAFRDAAADGA